MTRLYYATKLFYLLFFRLETGLDGIQASDLFVCETLNFDVWSRIVLATVDNPCSTCDEEHYAKGDDAVVHVGGGDGTFGRKDKEDCCEDGPEDANLILLVGTSGMI